MLVLNSQAQSALDLKNCFLFKKIISGGSGKMSKHEDFFKLDNTQILFLLFCFRDDALTTSHIS